ncbi:MAG TPA: FAD-dependent oxidoreductase [Acidimicrobiales bacterium]|nr:FAD-dependent oxidoreductase [Acidimicrobiales bacterium]
MTGQRQRFVIVGAGLAGAQAAQALRRRGFEGQVVLVGEEPTRPYERPPLSKEYLRGEATFDQAAVHKEGFYEGHDIELRTLDPVEAIDIDRAQVTLRSGEALGWDRLLLTTGAAPRRLPIPGVDLAGVHYLRDVAQADQLRGALEQATKVVVIGAGWIGTEVAASARTLGQDVALVHRGQVPFERTLGPEVGAVYRDLHADHGVDLHLGAEVVALRGTSAVEAVALGDGTVLDADLVLVGVGAEPRVDLAEAAGLALDNGVAVDERLATSAPGVYAAGDVASAYHPVYGTRIRLEHWSAARYQGRAAASAMLGEATSYDRIPDFWSDQYDLSMEYAGWAPRWDQVVVRGDLGRRAFAAFWLDDAGRVLAAMNANGGDGAEGFDAVVGSARPVEAARLTDPDVDLATLGEDEDG